MDGIIFFNFCKAIALLFHLNGSKFFFNYCKAVALLVDQKLIQSFISIFEGYDFTKNGLRYFFNFRKTLELFSDQKWIQHFRQF